MSVNEKSRISDAEWTVMQVLWQTGAASSQQIIEVLHNSVAWAPTTVRTLLKRLVDKGFVLVEETDSKRFMYKALISEQDSMIGAVENVLTHICSKKMGKTIAQLIDNTPLTHEDIALLNSVLEQKTHTAVDEIACDCLPGLCECKKHCCS